MQKPEVIHADPSLGLTEEQAAARREAGLAAGVPSPTGKTEGQILLTHCFTFFNLIFLILAAMLLIARSSFLNMGFLLVVIVNTVIGIFQELKAKRAVDQLALVARRPVTVVRDGAKREIPPEDVVRDDIAQFKQGDQICADGILRQGTLWADESLLTGEADSVEKHPGDTLHSGSVVVSGRGLAQLTAVGDASEAAQLSRQAKAHPRARKSGMMRSLDRLILFIGIALVPIGIILFHQEYRVLSLGLRESAEGTVAALTGMIPEGLYLLTSVALAVSTRKLSKKRVLVQDWNCIEALARVDVLCVDKTGTITEPTMEVENLVPLTELPPEKLQDMLTAMYGAAEPDNATAKAMAELFSGETSLRCTKRIPFSPETKWSGCTFDSGQSLVVGAPEYILGSRFGERKEEISAWTDQGYRVLLAAEYASPLAFGKLQEEALTPLALILLNSPLRPGAKETFAYFAQQGVSIRVISGDSPATASRIAMDAGIPGAENYIDASTLETDADFRKAADCTVFGRVTPEQKKKLVAALQKKGHTVAMTGDGVNDLLAMKQADCSIAMASGAQAASQLASLVLLDSQFPAMPDIVNEGRRVINNIQRAATLFLVKNIFSLFLSVITLFTSWPYPLEPIHLTVISALTIGLPSFLLTLEPRYDRIRGHFLRGVLRRAFPGGLTNVFVVLVCQAFRAVFGINGDHSSTVCAAILAMVGLMVLFQVCKPFDLFRKFLWAGMALGLVVCFTLLGNVLSLSSGSLEARLLMMTLLLMTPTVFFAIQRVFDWGDRLWGWTGALLRKITRPFRRKKLTIDN